MKELETRKRWHTVSAKEAARLLETDIETGLSAGSATSRLEIYGPNVLAQKKRKNAAVLFISQFNDFMILVLIGAAVISYVTSSLNGETDIIEPLIILGIITLNAILGVVQEIKAENAIEALKSMTAPNATVLRDGKTVQIKAAEVVPGDLVTLFAGDIVPADIRLISSSNLMVDESSLTGESEPVAKDAASMPRVDCQLSQMGNMAFFGTFVSYGSCTGIAVKTGMDTEVGAIAGMIQEEVSPQTPLQKRLESLGKSLGIGALIICAVVFLLGVMNGTPGFTMFMTSVSLAVAAIPEGLPAIVTIMLALGVTKMARKNAIVRKLPAVETLGNATVICTDKTGTITENKMEVVKVWAMRETSKKDAGKLLTYGALCSDVKENDGAIIGNPTEKALIVAAKSININKKVIDKQFSRVCDIPFDSKRKMMTTVHKDGGRFLFITKGAPDVVIDRCSSYEKDGSVLKMDERAKAAILAENTNMAKGALRVLAVAYKTANTSTHRITQESAESNLILLGLVGIMDPPRKEVAGAVKACKEAGIRPVMITGDHVLTAAKIAEKVGIMGHLDKAMTGQTLDTLNDGELARVIMDYAVFARVTPAHKVRIVKAFQSLSHVVAMTGDGVNDAVALKAADIGCAMGITGTDVAKNTADIILTDDNFKTIVEAVKEGRGIYDNIKKSAHFLLSSNIGEIITILAGILMGLPTPLVAIQLLWVNLVTDSLPAIALGLEPADKDIMKKRPANVKDGLFADGLFVRICLEGLMIGLLALIAFSFGLCYYDETFARTMAFCVLSMSQLVHAFNMKSEKSIFGADFFNNKYMFYAFFAGMVLQVSVVANSTLARVFSVTNLNADGWIVVFLLSLTPILILEIQKSFDKWRAGTGIKNIVQHS